MRRESFALILLCLFGRLIDELCGCDNIRLANLPVQRLERCLLHWVSNHAILEEYESVRGSEGERRLERACLNVRELSRRAAVDACDALNNEVLASQCASLVKAADVDSASEGNAEGFRAEDSWEKQQSCEPIS